MVLLYLVCIFLWAYFNQHGPYRYPTSPCFCSGIRRRRTVQEVQKEIDDSKGVGFIFWTIFYGIGTLWVLAGNSLAPNKNIFYKRLVASIGLPEARLHDLRHTYATISLHAGDDIKTVQENLGHHSAAFTLGQYVHATEKMKQDSANRMDQFIKGVSGA